MKDEVKLVLSTSWKPDLKDFLSALGVTNGGLGEQLFSPVYDALFLSSIEVKDEFHRYYSVEYAHLAEYVEIRYGEVLSERDIDADRIFIVTWLPQVIDKAYEDNKLDAVIECITKLGGEQSEA